MSGNRIDARSLLAIDIGSTLTRAMLFDAVEGSYRFLAEGTAPTTVGAPVRDVSEGVRLALDHLQTISGRQLIDGDERLITPTASDGSGVDAFVTTYSAGAPLRVFVVGMLDDISLESARHLVSTTYARLVGKLALTDRRKVEEQIDLIMRVRPDLILIAGGTDFGATQSVLNLVEPVGLACYLMSNENRPEILFAGNQTLAEEVKTRLDPVASVHTAPNIRPHLDEEQLGPAQFKMVEVTREILRRQVQGMHELATWSDDRVYPTSTAFGRVIRFLSKVYDPTKGVLGVKVDGAATTIAASFAGDLRLSVYPQLGLGEELGRRFPEEQLSAVTRWVPFSFSPEDLQDYLYNRSLHPDSLPITPEELAIDQALARFLLQRAVIMTRRSFPVGVKRPGPDLLPWFEPIVVAGSILTRAPVPGQSLLMLLDGIQPTGVTTLVMDQNNLGPALGAAAATNPILTVQVLESTGTFLNLGTVISPVGNARPGTPILQARLIYEDETEIAVDVKQGTLELLNLPIGQPARLHLQPLQRFDIGMGGPGRGGSLRVVGGAMGVVIDARGRPLRLPDDEERRLETLKKWQWVITG